MTTYPRKAELGKRMHARTIIRQTFVELLKGRTTTANRVYDSRLYNLESVGLPSIIVFATNETIATNTISKPRSQDRSLRITVECYAKATATVNVIVDNLAVQIEQLVASNQILRGLCKDCQLESTDINLNSEGDQPVAVVSIVFLVSYRTHEDRPEIII
ncbi:hypothetical protein [Candidatus Tisiphia endosymbiont of Ptychoptera albimana]|uniref:hypothetical protein n=1 Tax=Candidatus Tisiphia endosymbiont of Ptychoptera albimana TaxID=3066260 RepID=UPI001DCB0897|nr:hypothetical protein [Rickettsia endosymbiont of Sericostoma sp. HW-2014]